MKSAKKQGILTEIDLKKFKFKCVYYVMALIVFVTCLLVAIPAVWILLSGFKSPVEMYSTPVTFFPKSIDLRKLTASWNQMKFYKYYINTFILAGGTTLFTLLISGFAGYVISKLRPLGNGFLHAVIFWSMLIPSTMSTVPIYMSLIKTPLLGLNLSNSFVPLWFMGMDAFYIIMFKSFFDGISDSIIEAANIDGAGKITTFFTIIIPMSLPVFMTVMIFSFNSSMASYFWPYLLITDSSKTVLGVQLFKMKSANFSLDYQMLAIFFSIIPQILIFIFLQKNIVGGISTGAVKG